VNAYSRLEHTVTTILPWELLYCSSLKWNFAADHKI
jgi:hypothetical protein